MGSEREKEKNNTKTMPNNRSYLDTFTNGEIKSFHMECVKNNKDGMMMTEHNNNTRFIFRPASSLSLIKDTTTVAVGNVSKL